MPRTRAPPVRHPCQRCKAKHVKCDDSSGTCRRCSAQHIPCIRLPKQTRFLPGCAAQYESRFTGEETWVSGGKKAYRKRGQRSEQELQSISPALHPAQAVDCSSPVDLSVPMNGSNEACSHLASVSVQHVRAGEELHSPSCSIDVRVYNADKSTFEAESPWVEIDQSDDTINLRSTPNLNLHQACFLKYYIDNIASWFDTCDERQYFKLLVPVWARQYPPLLSAICAVSSRHLHRTRTSAVEDKIHYEGRVITGLTADTSVEYMLACIPTLRRFHEISDQRLREMILASAIILRQFEEMEDDDHEEASRQTKVNFLDIINAVIRDSYDEASIGRHEFLDVAYWICLRQEVYSAFTQKRTPQMLLAPEQWHKATTVNKTVMHAAQVAKWLFEGGQSTEWSRLSEQQAQLEQNLTSQTRYMPILERTPDRANGEVLPTLWYGSDLVTIAVQHVMIAKTVLTAEAPTLLTMHDRSAQRQVEAKVRRVILELCGIAMHRSTCPPTLVNAIMGILLYGDYFTDLWERRALADVIENFLDFKAWPLPGALRSFGPGP